MYGPSGIEAPGAADLLDLIGRRVQVSQPVRARSILEASGAHATTINRGLMGSSDECFRPSVVAEADIALATSRSRRLSRRGTSRVIAFASAAAPAAL
jgi:hypothetical protein